MSYRKLLIIHLNIGSKNYEELPTISLLAIIIFNRSNYAGIQFQNHKLESVHMYNVVGYRTVLELYMLKINNLVLILQKKQITIYIEQF